MTEATPTTNPREYSMPKPYRLVGEITAAQYDEAVEAVSLPLQPMADLEYMTIDGAELTWKVVEHARWVLDRIDSGMLRVAEEPEAGE